MKTLDYVIKKFNLDVGKPSPIEIPNVGRNDLPHWLHELNFKTGVEVGVAAHRRKTDQRADHFDADRCASVL